MKRILILIIMTIANTVIAQNFLDNNQNSVIKPDLKNGIPNEMKKNFKNFNNKTTFENIQGLPDGNYVTTSAQFSSITIEKENIGRIVLYAKLFNSNDTILYSPISKRAGKITVKLYRNNEIMNDMDTYKTFTFDEDIFQQIHINTTKAGIDKIIIDFETKNDLFIIEKLKISPYNKNGINYYKELENNQNEILNLSNNIENEAEKIKKQYKEQIKRIENSYISLNSLINGKKFLNLAKVQSNSLNPFKNDNFTKHYNKILKKASISEKAKLENLSKELKSKKFTNVAMTLDNLFLGGKFTSVINLIDNLFKTNINIKNNNSETISVIKLNGKHYYQKAISRGRFKLLPVTEQPVLDKIEQITLENKAYKIYVSEIAKFLKEDMESLKELDKEMVTAINLRKDLENLVWQILKEFTDKGRANYILETGGINFTEVATDLQSKLKPSNFENISKLKQLRNSSIISIKRSNELMIKYSNITSKIKTHYDVIYETRPTLRKKHFNDINKLPGELKSDWKDRQNEIIIEYKKTNGLKDFLSATTGKE